MKIELLGDEKIIMKIDGVLCKDEVESMATCILTDRRLIFEDTDILTLEDADMREEEVDLKKLAIETVLFRKNAEDEALRALGMRKDRGTVTIYSLNGLLNLRLSDTEIEAVALKEDKGRFEQVLFKVGKVWDDLGKTSKRLAIEYQKKFQTLVETAKEKAKSQKNEPNVNDKLLFLAERHVKQGYMNPGLKLEDEIWRKMKSGKTREQAIEELYKEETNSSCTSGKTEIKLAK